MKRLFLKSLLPSLTVSRYRNNPPRIKQQQNTGLTAARCSTAIRPQSPKTYVCRLAYASRRDIRPNRPSTRPDRTGPESSRGVAAAAAREAKLVTRTLNIPTSTDRQTMISLSPIHYVQKFSEITGSE
ncbi:hypothetical protein AgCh_014463 [Apium graveolens]